MKVEKSENIDDVSRIINHPKVYPMISDDGSPVFYYPHSSQLHIINEDRTGVIRVDPVNTICCVIHIALMPELWGHSVEFCQSAIEWGFFNTMFTKIMAMVPEYNRLTIRLAIKLEFKQEGIIEKSFLKHWKYWDQLLFGLTKTQFYKNKEF